MNIKTAISAFVLLFCVVCGGKTVSGHDKDKDFTLTSLEGQEYTLSKLKGNVVILDFWATWCPPCRREIPHLVAIYNKYKDKNLIVIGISAEEKSTLEIFKKENNVNYPILLGNNEVFQRFGVQSIPHTLFIDRKGKIRKTQVGYADELLPVFEALIDTLINE